MSSAYVEMLPDHKLTLKRNPDRSRQGTQKWSYEKRIDCVTKYMALGNRQLVAELTGVSYATLRVWMKADWWKELEQEIKASRRIEKDTKLSKLVSKALEAVEDRLDNGNIKYDFKSKELYRTPVSILEANKVVNDLMQRQEALEKVSVEEFKLEKTQSIQDQLKLLAGEFAKFNTGRTVDVIATEVTDAIHEGRETRLQEGSEGVHEQAGSEEEEGGTEQGEEDDGESWEGDEGGWPPSGSYQATQ